MLVQLAGQLVMWLVDQQVGGYVVRWRPRGTDYPATSGGATPELGHGQSSGVIKHMHNFDYGFPIRIPSRGLGGQRHQEISILHTIYKLRLSFDNRRQKGQLFFLKVAIVFNQDTSRFLEFAGTPRHFGIYVDA